MTYSPTWTNENAQHRLDAGIHAICSIDMSELALAVNRRRELTYQSPQNFSLPQPVQTSPGSDFREHIESLVSPPVGSLGGSPASPQAMAWLWPVGDGDEDKIIVTTTPSAGEVNLFTRLNGGSDFDGASLSGGDDICAIYVNELRQALEWLRRGRWTLPVYLDNWAKVHPSLAAVINRIVLVGKTAQSLRQSPQYQQAIEAYQQSRNEVNLLNRLIELAGPVLNTFLKL